jgi:hypothetical protein
MELEGILRATSLPELLQFLSTGKKTGILTVRNEDRTISLMINEGKIINSSSAERPRKLGEMLVNRGFLRRSELEKALAMQKSQGAEKLIGEILVEENLISPDILKDTVRLQLEEEIWELFAWKEGTFQFRYQKDKHFSNITVELDVEPFLLEGSRRLDEWSKISRNIDNENLVVSVNTLSVEDFEREYTLSESEWKVLSLINGFYNVGSLVMRSGLSKFETFRILNSFLVAGLISIHEPSDIIQNDMNTIEEEMVESAEELQEDVTQRPANKFALKLPFRKTAIQEKRLSPLSFISPIGCIANFINALFYRLSQERDFPSSDDDDKLVSMLWHETLMNYPLADIIKASDNHLIPDDMEYLIEELGIDNEILFSCYEESTAALKDLYENICSIITLRLGDKKTQNIINSLLEETEKRLTIKNDTNFSLSNFVKSTLT